MHAHMPACSPRGLAAALALTLASCASAPPEPRWWHASATEQQARVDTWECYRDASMAAPPSQRIASTGGYSVGGTWIPPVVSSRDESGPRRTTLVRMCMRARGWQQGETDPFAAQRAPGSVASVVR
jgi:hypothetical protein